jgi:hypothetical protein
VLWPEVSSSATGPETNRESGSWGSSDGWDRSVWLSSSVAASSRWLVAMAACASAFADASSVARVLSAAPTPRSKSATMLTRRLCSFAVATKAVPPAPTHDCDCMRPPSAARSTACRSASAAAEFADAPSRATDGGSASCRAAVSFSPASGSCLIGASVEWRPHRRSGSCPVRRRCSERNPQRRQPLTNKPRPPAGRSKRARPHTPHRLPRRRCSRAAHPP